MIILLKTLFLLTLAHNTFAQLPAVKNVSLSVASDGAFITFQEVKGAVSYMGILTGQNVTVESTTPSLYFSELESFTSYEVLITPIDLLNQPGIFEIVEFKTGPGEVQNIKVTTVSGSLLSVEWDAMEDVEIYPLDFAEADEIFVPLEDAEEEFKPVPSTIETSSTSRTFTNLLPMTYYTLRVRAQFGTVLGPETVHNFRTDGSGIHYNSVWSNHDRERGASGKIYRTLDIPNGDYKLRLKFPCEVAKFEYWNAQLDEEASDPDKGLYALVQSEQWELDKTEIGFNFEYKFNETNPEQQCLFSRSNISLEFGDDSAGSDQADIVTEKYALNTTVMIWPADGGILYINAGGVFLDPNTAMQSNETILLEKPKYGIVAFEVKMTEECDAINMEHCWNFDRVYDFDQEEGELKAYYFIQTKEHWHTNDIGIVFDYSRLNCQDPSGIQVSALVGGEFVRTLTQLYEFQEYADTCSDLNAE